MDLGELKSKLPRVDTAGDAVRLLLLVISPYLFWVYSKKFLGLSADYLSKMSRSIMVTDPITGVKTQANQAYFPMDSLVLLYGGFILLLFLLVQNEFSTLSKLIKALLRIPKKAIGTILGSDDGTSDMLEDSSGTPLDSDGDGHNDLDGSLVSTKDRIDPITGVKVSEYQQVVESYGGQLRWILHLLSGLSNTIFGVIAFMAAFYCVTEVFELTPAKQVPFFFLGGAFLSGLLLLQDNISDALSLPLKFREYFPDDSSISRQQFGLQTIRNAAPVLVTVIAILAFPFITLNNVMFPLLFEDIATSISAMTLLTFFAWGFIISGEGAKPTVQSKRMSAFAFLAFFPLFSYLFLRVLFLMNDGSDPVMLNRWSLDFLFMDAGNKFAIEPWPIEVLPNIDSRWVFMKAAVINSARVTLVSIVLCTIGGIIVGVSRLSNNRLASGAATVYVELFRNLPLAVLLFLISVQMGQDLPMFVAESTILEQSRTEDATVAGAFISKQGVYFVDFASYQLVLFGVTILALTRAGLRFFERVEPRKINAPSNSGEFLFRPYSVLNWRLEPLIADIALIVSALVFIDATLPFIAAPAGGDAQLLKAILDEAVYPLASLFFVIYCLSVISAIDSSGMNNLEVDDTEEGLRRRFTIWTLSFAVAMGVALSGGLSWPKLTKDWNNDGFIDQPGNWTILDGAGFEMTPSFLAMMLGLTLFTTAVVAEIVRGSIQSLPRGQVEAAISLSLNPFQRLRLVILPQALRSMVPLLNSQYMNVWKNSSLAIVVGYTDVFYNVVIMMNNVGKLIPLFVLLLVTYQVGSLSISVVMNWYNSKVTSVKI